MKIILCPTEPVDINIFADAWVSAIILSLFCDARSKNDLGKTQRGWWAESLIKFNFKFGSLLWLLKRSKEMPETLTQAEDYAKSALNWMLLDQVAQSIGVYASNPQSGVLLLEINIDAKKYTLEVKDAY